MTPALVTTNKSSSPFADFKAIKLPFLSDALMVFTPLAPRLVCRYSSKAVSLPNPLLVTTRIYLPSELMETPMTLAPSASFIPRTPAAVRPMSRTSLSTKVTILPLEEARLTNKEPVVCLTSNNISPSLNPIAIFPFCRIDSNSLISVRLTTPFSVTKNK